MALHYHKSVPSIFCLASLKTWGTLLLYTTVKSGASKSSVVGSWYNTEALMHNFRQIVVDYSLLVFVPITVFQGITLCLRIFDPVHLTGTH